MSCYPAPTSDSAKDLDNESEVIYVELPQHPDAQKIYSSFSIDNKLSEITIGEKVYFEALDHDICLHEFFECEPVVQYVTGTRLEHCVRAHTLFKLRQQENIALFSFNSGAGMTPLATGPKQEVLAPGKGMFVIVWGEIKIVLDIEVSSYGAPGWTFYSKSVAEFSSWYKYFKRQWKCCNQYTNKVFDASGKFLTLPALTFDDIYLEDYIREEVVTNILDYVNPDKIRFKLEQGLPTKRGLIFAGEPGTGKTFLANIIAGTAGTTFMIVSHLSDTQELEGLFEFISLFDRFILLLEDVDIYSGNRDQTSLSTLLNKLDGLQVNHHLITICTTNSLESLDDALKNRPGRFDRILVFKPPSTQLKAKMLEGFCIKQDTTELDFLELAKVLPSNYTGAHVKELFITACTEAIDSDSVATDGKVQLLPAHFEIALRRLKQVQDTSSQAGFEQ